MNNPVIKLENAEVFQGHNLDVLKTFSDNSVDSIVTDPPYELGFMNKAWDASGIAYNVELWRECLRVLKPGGHLLAFGGSRTWHRLAVAIEDAGFEMRDSIAWLYGSGFPKSHNISKAIDKAAGANIKVGKAFKVAGEYDGRELRDPESLGNNRDEMRHSAITDDAMKWDGWGTALKPAFEPIVVARKPLIGTVAENVLTWGVGGLNIDASRIGTETISVHNAPKGSFAGGEQDRGSDTDSYREHTGRWPANVMFTHTEDCVQIGTREEKYSINQTESWSGFGQVEKPDYESKEQVVSSVVFECVDGCPVKELDKQAPNTGAFAKVKSGHNGKSRGIYGDYATRGDDGATFYEDGLSGASRFFYVAKASKRDRNEGLDNIEGASIGAKGNGLARICEKCGTSILKPCECPDRTYINPVRQNFHPTVKPTTLMSYLIKLVTPIGATVLDPFAGSGSTGKAALLEGYKFIGIELTAEYLPIIEGRLKHAQTTYNNKQETLFDD